MKEEIIIAGFGGQGIMLIGKLLAHAGMKEGYQVSWMPSYGPEMRGGTANCMVKISTERIASPFSSRADSMIIMNLPSLEKFESYLKTDGSIYINSSLIKRGLEREDIKNIVEVPANTLAIELGEARAANMIMLGAYIADHDFISLDTIKESLKEVLPVRRHNFISVNKEALDLGAAILQKV